MSLKFINYVGQASAAVFPLVRENKNFKHVTINIKMIDTKVRVGGYSFIYLPPSETRVSFNRQQPRDIVFHCALPAKKISGFRL